MKKLIILAILLLAAFTTSAQDWKDALKKAATTAADQASEGKLTEAALVGAWTYAKPVIKFERDDVLAAVSGAAIERTVQQYLDKAYQMAEIKPGSSSFIFANDKSFKATLGKYNLTGTYEYNAATHVVTLLFSKDKLDLGSIPGHAYLSGSNLQLVFSVEKLVDLIEKLGQKVDSLAQVTALLEQYKQIYLGFEFTK